MINSKNDCFCLQTHLEKLNTWTQRWGMRFSTSKCKIMNMAKNKSNVKKFYYNIDGIILENQFVDLHVGITVTSNLSWNIHVKNCVNKAQQRLA